MMYVRFIDATQTLINVAFPSPQDPEVWPGLVEVEDDDPRYLAFMNPQPSTEDLAAAARLERDGRLKAIYDAGINMALRGVRMASTPEELSYAEGKVIELDNYAQALEDIPDQPGFPQTIDWPVAPTR